MGSQKEKGVQITQVAPRFRILTADKPPTGVHFIGFNRMGGEIVMDMGYFNMRDVVAAINKAKKMGGQLEEVEVNVFAQYSMSADTFLRLRMNVEEIYKAIKESGQLQVEEEETE